MKFFYDVSGDYGVAIIMLTLAVRILILPLTIKQTRSMQAMKKLQPKLKKLQAKYKDDKQKLQQEIMKFYSEHKVNPVAGCLPLILQLPIMFALFRVLLDLGDGGKEPIPFLFLIPNLDLSAAQARATLALGQMMPYLVLVGLMILTTYIPSKMMSTDPQQDKIMIFMSLFMAYIGWSLPAGVLLYLVVSNIWTVGQQYLSLRGTETVA